MSSLYSISIYGYKTNTVVSPLPRFCDSDTGTRGHADTRTQWHSDTVTQWHSKKYLKNILSCCTRFRTRGHADTRTRGHADTRTQWHSDTVTQKKYFEKNNFEKIFLKLFFEKIFWNLLSDAEEFVVDTTCSGDASSNLGAEECVGHRIPVMWLENVIWLYSMQIYVHVYFIALLS